MPGPKKVLLASPRGYCAGVDRAVIAVEKALERWSAEALARALTRLQGAILQTRRRPDLAVALARQALLGIAVESARLVRR